MRRKLISLLVFIAGLSIGSIANAESDAEPGGRIKAEGCLGCHGIEGYRNAYPSYRVPKLGGQSETYLVAALKSYRSGDREHPTMRAQGATLSDKDIADIAAYFANYSAEN